MKIKLLAVGTKMPAWVTTGYQEYAKRLPADMQLQLQELPLGFHDKYFFLLNELLVFSGEENVALNITINIG